MRRLTTLAERGLREFHGGKAAGAAADAVGWGLPLAQDRGLPHRRRRDDADLPGAPTCRGEIGVREHRLAKARRCCARRFSGRTRSARSRRLVKERAYARPTERPRSRARARPAQAKDGPRPGVKAAACWVRLSWDWTARADRGTGSSSPTCSRRRTLADEAQIARLPSYRSAEVCYGAKRTRAAIDSMPDESRSRSATGYGRLSIQAEKQSSRAGDRRALLRLCRGAVGSVRTRIAPPYS
jgi:hypothetical protein